MARRHDDDDDDDEDEDDDDRTSMWACNALVSVTSTVLRKTRMEQFKTQGDHRYCEKVTMMKGDDDE